MAVVEDPSAATTSHEIPDQDLPALPLEEDASTERLAHDPRTEGMASDTVGVIAELGAVELTEVLFAAA